ncbi:hypothetical protein Vretifemale_20031, partial [Volvox reticuliferus]
MQPQQPATTFNMGMQPISHNGMMPPSFPFGAPEYQGVGPFSPLAHQPTQQPTYGTSAGDGRDVTAVAQQLNDVRGRVNSQGHLLERLNTNVNHIGNMMHSQNQVLHSHGQNLNQLAGQLNNIQQVSDTADYNTPVPFARLLPRPPYLTGDPKHDSKTISDKLVWYNAVVEYMKLTGMNHVSNFKFFLQGPASKWFDSLQRYHMLKGVTLDGATLAQEFKKAFGDPTYMHELLEARERLQRGEAVQTPGMTVSEYVQKFLLILLDAPDMAETDKISWFFTHMQPSLAKAAAVDEDNRRHKTLESAIKAAYAAEHRMKVAKSVRVTAAVAAATAP